MTNERAIELLHRLQDEQFDGIHGDERREALEMAVRALEQNLVQESGGLVKDLVKDCISRKMAIEAFEPEHHTDWYTPTIIETLEALPSAQPETHDKHTETHERDCISRQAAIDALKSQLSDWNDDYNIPVRKSIENIERLPSAQPQWIPFSKMMPAFGESVLVQFDDDDMDILTFPNIYKRLKRVAWMPLPEPYGGESDV